MRVKVIPLGFCCVSLCGLAMAEEKPIEVGHFRQLFVDDYLIAERSNVTLTLHRPAKHPGNPVLLPDKPWEEKSVALYGTVLYDAEEGLFKMWYRAIEDTCYACYATSKDGIHWEKPVLNVKPYKGSTENNIVLGSVDPKFYLDGFAVIKEPEEADPKRRYKMLTYNGGRRFAAMVSPDGIHWDGPINPKEHDTGDVVSMYRDTGLGQYVALLKRRYIYENGTKVRARLTSFSNDFVHWSAPEFNLVPDEHDPPSTHFYSQVAYMYQGLRIGYVTLFVKETELIDTHLCYSRDGRTWHRYRERVPFLPNTPGTFDAGMLLADASGLINAPLPTALPARDGKIWIYYCGYSTDHAGREPGKSPVKNGIGLAHLRLDGFVSADAGEKGGTLLTKPLVCSGTALRVNGVAAAGEIRAELLDADGGVIRGCDLASAVTFTGDSLDAVLRWKKGIPAETVGKAVRIRFHLQNARLYSFWFAEE